MSSTPNPYENLQRLIKAYQESAKTFQSTFVTLSKKFDPILQASVQLQGMMSKIAEQIKKNFVDALSGLEIPEKYNSTIVLREGIHSMASNFTGYLDEINRSPISYLKDRLQIGLDAHFNQNYHLSLFCIFSVIDGILAWSYCQKNDCVKHRPGFDDKLKNFLNVYKFEDIIGKKELEIKFNIFLLHRHQIMHGVRFAQFDRNLSTIALLFLGIVYNSVREEFPKSK